jgi:hypothetical protein
MGVNTNIANANNVAVSGGTCESQSKRDGLVSTGIGTRGMFEILYAKRQPFPTNLVIIPT